MIREGGEWKTVDWQHALDFVSQRIRSVVDMHGGPALGTLVSPHSTLEEMALAATRTGNRPRSSRHAGEVKL